MQFKQLSGKFDLFIVKMDKITYAGIVKPKLEFLNVTNQTIGWNVITLHFVLTRTDLVDVWVNKQCLSVCMWKTLYVWDHPWSYGDNFLLSGNNS